MGEQPVIITTAQIAIPTIKKPANSRRTLCSTFMPAKKAANKARVKIFLLIF
jgi:hypothetical protein